MEVIVGDNDYIVIVVGIVLYRLNMLVDVFKNEFGCFFIFNFFNVYWNFCFYYEYECFISLFFFGCVIVDVMVGVGFFVIFVVKKGCYVFGNDFNFDSVKWMRENRFKNKVCY